MSLSHLLLVPFSSNLICQNFDGDYRHRTSEGRRPLLLSLRYNNHLFCHTKPKDFLTPTVKKTHTFSRREGILHKPIHHLKTAVKLSLLNVYSIFRIENSAAPPHQQNKVKLGLTCSNRIVRLRSYAPSIPTAMFAAVLRFAGFYCPATSEAIEGSARDWGRRGCSLSCLHDWCSWGHLWHHSPD